MDRKSIWRVALSIIILLANNAHSQPLHLGTEAIVKNQMYVVYSGMSWLNNGSLAEISNIYVIKGLADTVWVFGAGYGDPNGDVAPRRLGRDCTRSGLADAAEVDSVITRFLGLSPASVKFMFIAPHYHFDHINVEFLAPFFERFGYDSTTARIFIHTNDYFPAVCTYDSSCGNIWGGPEHLPWSDAPYLLNLIEQLGIPTDICNTVVKTFHSTTGLWHVKKDRETSDGGHTDGSVNLDNADLKYRILGAGARNRCSVPAEWTTLGIHGNISIPTGVEDEHSALPITFQLEQNYPNPFNPTTTIHFSLLTREHVTLKVFDVLGREVVTLVNEMKQPGLYEVTWEASNVPSGVYFYRFTAGQYIQTGKAVLAK